MPTFTVSMNAVMRETATSAIASAVELGNTLPEDFPHVLDTVRRIMRSAECGRASLVLGPETTHLLDILCCDALAHVTELASESLELETMSDVDDALARINLAISVLECMRVITGGIGGNLMERKG